MQLPIFRVMPQQLAWTTAEAKLVLQAIKNVGTAGGVLKLPPIILDMMEAIQTHVLHSDIDLQNLAIIPPIQYPELISNPDQREQLIQMLVLIPYVDMTVDARMVGVVDDFAEFLQVNPQTLRDLHQVRDNHLRRLLLDYGRRSMGEFLRLDSPSKFVRGIISAIHQAIGDPTVASRYQTLQDYPEGSLGHSFFHWYRDRNWALPGEHKSTSELLVNHDCCHILGGFNTDTRGEMNVAAFQAGLFTDGFGFESLLEVMLDFHLGKSFSTTNSLLPPETGKFIPDEAMAGYEKGLACTMNLIQDFDFWEHADQQVTELREQFHIPPTPGPVLLKP